LLTVGPYSQTPGRTSPGRGVRSMCNRGSKSPVRNLVVLRTHLHRGAAGPGLVSRSQRRRWGATTKTSGSRARVGPPHRSMTHQVTRVRARRHRRKCPPRPLSIM
jgi:hypothetical protein